MAEQAINTIYTLCEHPDVLCNDLIKHLARRVFTPKSNNDEEQITARPQTAADPDAMDEDQEMRPSAESGKHDLIYVYMFMIYYRVYF